MVKSDRLQMAMIAQEITQKLNVDVQVGGAEAEAAILGALTTPGTTRPLAILDLGPDRLTPLSLILRVTLLPHTWRAQAIWSR